MNDNMNNHTAGVAPAILRRHPGLDRGQLELIGHLEGPTLGIAGPGRRQDAGGGAARHEHPAAGKCETGGAGVVHLLAGRGPRAGTAVHRAGHRGGYTGDLSRPRGLLVLTASGRVHPRFNPIWEYAPRWTEMDPTALATLARQRFRTVEDDVGSERAAAPKPQRKIYRFKRLDVHIGRRRRAGASQTNPDGGPGRA